MRVIAHRGASAYFPENTLPAFRAALQLGAGAVEFDVQQTRDAVLAVIHDTDLRRLCGEAKRVGELSFKELSGRDVGRWFSPRFARARVPRLEEVLELLLGHGAEAHLELKQPEPPRKPYEGIERRVLEALRGRPGARAGVLISSFDHAALRRLRSLDRGVRLGYLAFRQTAQQAVQEAAELSCESVHIHRKSVSPEWARCAKSRHLKLRVYTVDDPAEAERLRSLGVEAVFSNRPDLLRGPDKLGGSA